jgi:hypothetical protein
MELYTIKAVTEIAGIDKELLSQWLKRGQVVPDRKAEGTGTRNLFSGATICKILLFKELCESANINRKRASALVFSDGFKNLFEYYLNLPLNTLSPEHNTPPVFSLAIFGEDTDLEIELIVSEEKFHALYRKVMTMKTRIIPLYRIVLHVASQLVNRER